MTLTEIVRAHPTRFYDQKWWHGHAFAETTTSGLVTMPTDFVRAPPEMFGFLPHAVTLAALYVEHPDDPIWQHNLWTCDHDDLGNRVYVAGVGKYDIPTFQIHRALPYTGDTFGGAVWTGR